MTTRKDGFLQSAEPPPPEAVAAIKLTRADAVKMVATEMVEQSAGDAERWGAAVIDAASRFRDYMVNIAEGEYMGVAQKALEAVGGTKLHATCTYRVYRNGDDSGNTARVVFSDHQQSYEAKLQLGVDVALNDCARVKRDAWLSALQSLEAAHERDRRMGAMKKEARELLIKGALADTPEGQDVVDAIRALAAALRAEV